MGILELAIMEFRIICSFFLLAVTCVTGKEPKTRETECMNQYPESKCQKWKDAGHCEKGNKFHTFMNAECKLQCGFCKLNLPDPRSCPDMSNKCKAWSKKGYCKNKKYGSWMAKNCKNSCKICAIDGNWGAWVEFTPCKYPRSRDAKDVPGLGKCVEGTQRRYRLCNSPKPKGGGRPCSGRRTTKRKGQLAQERTRKCGCKRCNAGKAKNADCNKWAAAGSCTDKKWSTYMEKNCGIQCKTCVKMPEKMTPTQKKGEPCGEGKGECIEGLVCSQDKCVTKVWEPATDGRCGQNFIIGGRVIGGIDTKPGEMPWQVGLWKVGTDGWNDEFYCGGTVINEWFVLTAAHCIEEVWEEDLVLKFGDHNRDKTIEMEKKGKPPRGFQRGEVELIIPHDGWDAETLENDIAMLKLRTPIKFTRTVQPACLPTSQEDAPVVDPEKNQNFKCYISGWGKTKGGKDGQTANILQKAEMPLISRKVCADMNNRNSPNKINGYLMLCAGQGPDSIVSGCQGDSGGPLVCIDNAQADKKYVLTGAVSWGDRDCRSKEKYTVFARVSHYLPWIHQTMKDNAPPKEKNA